MFKFSLIVLICLSGLVKADDAVVGIQPLPISADFLPPTHVDTVTSLASATVTLQASNLDDSEITSVMILCYDASTSQFFNVTLPIEDNESRSFEVTIPDLTHNTHYTCNAQWLPTESLFSTSFEFNTLDIPTKRVSVSGVSSNSFTLSWEETTTLISYVESYTIVIRAVEPNHFIQERCNAVLDESYTVELLPGESTYTFTNALPNYRYEVSTITTFTTGLESSTSTVTVFTSASAPGRITDLGGRLISEQCERFAATAAFTWSPPCDINGNLDRFEATVTAFFTIDNEELQHSYTKTLTADDADENYQFSLEIPLNPFFRYSLSVDVFAAEAGETSALVSSILPPTAYAVCNSS